MTFGDNWSNFEKSPQNKSAGLTTVKGPDRLKIAKTVNFANSYAFWSARGPKSG